ncbi:rod shape-determining protein RodA [Candidatus Dependentiae bacterium]|nr:rod shape-determining protein RodA [Candidatus Dependentiae bacterium]MBU4387718.1 rod shape-determining protein RodA [Candidatus Dependentiae bacterium]MCG2755975.1 rod shape-determining protein RodA [Candidatus Dependentiae bacterium]
MFKYKYFYYFDKTITFTILALLLLGLLFVFSATYTPEAPISIFFKKQLFGAITGIFIYIFFSVKNIEATKRYGFAGFFLTLIILAYTILKGFVAMGAKRWFSIYFFKFQPSELTKFLFPLFIAYYFCELKPIKIDALNRIVIKNFLFPLSILFIVFILILKQPDLGTALIILLSGIILFWVIGINKKFIIFSFIIVFISAPFLWTKLKPYQKQRILVLLGEGNVRKERYQLEQSKIAIGSGGIFGKGLLKGTQNKLAFLPEARTDFIFSVICEELGFFGAILIFILFSILFFKIIVIASQLSNLAEQIIAIGLMLHILLSVCINIGMVTGILPIVGIPLPLFSYGVTNLWITMASLGVINNISIRRFYY